MTGAVRLSKKIVRTDSRECLELSLVLSGVGVGNVVGFRVGGESIIDIFRRLFNDSSNLKQSNDDRKILKIDVILSGY